MTPHIAGGSRLGEPPPHGCYDPGDRHTGSSLIGLGQRTDLLNAALINGTSAHADLFDDNNAPMMAHPSSPLVSALVPLAQAKGVGGAELLVAYCAGFEVGVTFGRALNSKLYEAGWHATRVLGVIGAAAAAARLLRLDRRFDRCAELESRIRKGFRKKSQEGGRTVHVKRWNHIGCSMSISSQRKAVFSPAGPVPAGGPTAMRFFR
jgi:hypothetical protein